MELEQRMKLWKEYEGVAMHFNELLIRLRTQALGAVATIVTAAGLVLHQSGSTTTGEQWPAICAVSVLLLLVWGSLWMIDVSYYSKLLRGAVNALVEIENGSEEMINLSCHIEKLVTGKAGVSDRINWQVRFFYLPVFLFLFSVTALSIYELF
jgi:hypothetical protein